MDQYGNSVHVDKYDASFMPKATTVKQVNFTGNLIS